MSKKTIGCYESRPYERTVTGLCYKLYYDQCKSSKHRGHLEPQYSKDDLYQWIISQPNFNTLYESWVDSNYASELRPSCDRLDNTIGYTFDNIELVTWKENKRRANADVASCTIMLNQTQVYQYSTDGHFMRSYQSIAEACRLDLSLDQRNITACCQGKIPTAYGYFWSYRDLGNRIPELKTNESYMCEIFQYDPFSGDIVNIYETILDIPEPQFNHMKVRSVIQGTYKTHEGFFWSKEYLSPDQIKVDTTYLPKRIIQLSKQLEPLHVYSSMSEASKATGIGSGNISKVCNGKANSAGGFIWKYESSFEI